LHYILSQFDDVSYLRVRDLRDEARCSSEEEQLQMSSLGSLHNLHVAVLVELISLEKSAADADKANKLGRLYALRRDNRESKDMFMMGAFLTRDNYSHND